MPHLTPLVFLSAVFMAVAACSTPGPCGDGSDNDDDGLIDDADRGCSLSSGASEGMGAESACSDGADNDGDGLLDLGDPGCASADDGNEENPPLSQCNDGIDNDGDGLVDFPLDPGCTLTLEDDEADSCPERCPACGNGMDDDGDGLADYPDDPGCDSAADSQEIDIAPTACGPTVSLDPVVPGDVVTANFMGTEDNQLISPTCGGTGPEAAYLLSLSRKATVRVTTAFPETTLDTVLYLRTDCRKPKTELDCNDDAETPAAELLAEDLDPGDYFIVVDTHVGQETGDYKLAFQIYNVEGETCDPAASTCAPGLICQPDAADATQGTCQPAACANGMDDDGDGDGDFPDDPGCTESDDDDESDDCPSGSTCPQCGNGIDDDSDDLVDFPDDPDCASASDSEGPPGASCTGFCGGFSPSGCACDAQCESFGDCCPDKTAVCGSGDSCVGHCGGFAPGGCACDSVCESFGDCCSDKATVCP